MVKVVILVLLPFLFAVPHRLAVAVSLYLGSEERFFMHFRLHPTEDEALRNFLPGYFPI